MSVGKQSFEEVGVRSSRCDALGDRDLSWRAKGLLWYLLSRSDGWKGTRSELVDASREGRDATLAALSELKSSGYVCIRPLRSGTRFVGCEWHVSETPVKKWIKDGKEPIQTSKVPLHEDRDSSS